MAGYLDEYGVSDARRERRRKRLLLWGVAAVILGTFAFFYLRNWGEERAIDRFVALLQQHKYSEAYQQWQTPDSAKFYPPEKFAEDWGASGVYKNAADLKIRIVDSCDAGVVFDMVYPGAEDFGLWVERKTKIISFAPWTRCPGPHLHLWEFLKARFGGGG